jgi:hypothetical protein
MHNGATPGPCMAKRRAVFNSVHQIDPYTPFPGVLIVVGVPIIITLKKAKMGHVMHNGATTGPCIIKQRAEFHSAHQTDLLAPSQGVLIVFEGQSLSH